MSRQDANAAFANSSFLYGGNAAYIEELHARYEADPKAVDAQWQAFFAGVDTGATAGLPGSATDRLSQSTYDLVHSYRELGHCIARLDPLAHQRPPHPLLELSEFGLSDADLDRPILRNQCPIGCCRK